MGFRLRTPVLATVEPVTLALVLEAKTLAQGSGSNHVSGGMWTVSAANPCPPGVHGPCAYPCASSPVNIGSGAGGCTMNSASGCANHCNGQANVGCKPPCQVLSLCHRVCLNIATDTNGIMVLNKSGCYKYK
ncbi:hypothetical protein SLA2020_529190 [Shorea laevis]